MRSLRMSGKGRKADSPIKRCPLGRSQPDDGRPPLKRRTGWTSSSARLCGMNGNRSVLGASGEGRERVAAIVGDEQLL
jgi:hypothetical protein